MLNIIGIAFPSIPSNISAASANQASPSWFYKGWQYREAHDLTTAQPVPPSQQDFFDMSNGGTTILGNPSQQHAFQPVHDSTIIQLNKPVDGNTWKYLAYDCDPLGSEINLFYTNDTAGTWTPYSANPILGPNPDYYRWPSTTYLDGTFFMFLENYSGYTLELWTSSDGIHYTFDEILKSGGNPYKNPFIWHNTVDNLWYLYSHDSTSNTESLEVRSADTLGGLKTASDIIVLSRNLPFGSPSVMYFDGEYWLLAEILQDSVWQTVAYYSTSPTSGFVEASNSPVLRNDEACPMIYLTEDQTKAYLYTTANSAVWNEETREVYLNRVIQQKSDLTDYQIRVVVNYGYGSSIGDTVYLDGCSQPDFSDVRFTWFNESSNSEVECSYWIENTAVGSQATFWVKIPLILSSSYSTMYIYYGKSNVTTTSDGTKTFEFFDDFSAGLSKWTAVGGSWLTQNGVLIAQTDAFGQRLIANNFSFGNDSVHVNVQWIAGTYFENGPCIRGQSSDDQSSGYVTFLSTWPYDNRQRISLLINNKGITLAGQGTTDPVKNLWYTFVFSGYGNTLESEILPFYSSQISAQDSTFNTGTLCLFDWSSAAETVLYDNVFVTKHTYAEPIQGNWSVEREVYPVYLMLNTTPQDTYAKGQQVTFEVTVLNQQNPKLETTLSLTITGPGGYSFYDFQPINVSANSVGEYTFSWTVPNVKGRYIVEASLVPAQLTAYDAKWLQTDELNSGSAGSNAPNFGFSNNLLNEAFALFVLILSQGLGGIYIAALLNYKNKKIGALTHMLRKPWRLNSQFQSTFHSNR